jgi:hypothetical protein
MIKRLSRNACNVFRKTFKVFYVIAFLQPLLFSCKSVPISSIRKEDEFAQFIYERYKRFDSKYYSCDQVNISINDGEVSKSAKAKIYIQKGDFIFMSINILGIELGRVEIRPDSIKIINRIEKTYYFDKLVGFNSSLKIDFTYNKIENLILKGIVLDDNVNLKKFKNYISESRDSYIYVYKNFDMPAINTYFLKDSFQQTKIEIGNILSDFYLLVTLLNYENLNSYPKEINVTLKRKEYRADIKVEIGKISNNKIGNRSFELNKKYREIEF